MPKPYRLVGFALGVALMTAAVAPASAQTTVDVTLQSGAGSRTLYVENMVGQPLDALDFGQARSMPFRVRVVDSEFARQGFSVSATMTNLYLDNGALDYDEVIPSSDLALGSQVVALNVLNVEATVQPLVDTVSTVASPVICGILGVALTALGGTACVLNASDLVGEVQTVSVPVDLNDLGNLPLLPQPNEVGDFTAAEYGAGTAGADDPAASSAPPATPLRVLGGSRVDTSLVLTELGNALATSPLSTLVDSSEVIAALQGQFPTVWGLLSASQIDAIIASTVGSVVPLTVSEVLAQSGTYMSLPTLDVTVPASATPGAYRGTLVVTALQ